METIGRSRAQPARTARPARGRTRDGARRPRLRCGRTWLAQQSWRAAQPSSVRSSARSCWRCCSTRSAARSSRSSSPSRHAPRSGSAPTSCSTRPEAGGNGSTRSGSARSAPCSAIVLHGNGLTLGSDGGTLAWVVGPLARRRGVRRHRFPAGGDRRPAAASDHLDRRIQAHRRRRSVCCSVRSTTPASTGSPRSSTRVVVASARCGPERRREATPAERGARRCGHRLGARVLGRCRRR